MSTQTVSPAFIGRQAELTILTEAYEQARDGATGTVLLGGEAGGGKTRLVNEFVARVHEDTLVLVGGCLELSTAGLPYAPFAAALRQLVREAGAAEISALLPRDGARDLARLLPEFGEPAAESDPATARARLFEQMLALAERLAERRPLVLVIEDAHWADRSTRDLATFLVRSLRDAAVLLIITFRSDELTRTHPLRPMLAELDRVEGVRRLELPRLSRSEVAGQLHGILGHQPDPRLVDAVYGRSSGIPLFVEATAHWDGGSRYAVSESLRDLLLVSVNRLPEETQQVLRTVTAGGTHIRHTLLSAVTGLDDSALTAILRPAVDANVLLTDRDGYVFRHALIREAIHEDLLPGEHSRTHRRFAEALTEDPDLGRAGRYAVEVAAHWSAAHDNVKALTAAWQAAADSEMAFAYAEQLQMLEKVLELWDRVPDAAERLGVGQVEVLKRAAAAAWAYGEPDRGVAFVRAALAEVDEAHDPELVALLLLQRARLNADRGVQGPLDDLWAAERLVPDPSPVRARVLSLLSSRLLLLGENASAMPILEETLELAHRFDDSMILADALGNRGIAESQAGDFTAARLSQAASRAAAERTGSSRLMLRAILNTADELDASGDSEQAIAMAQEGLAAAQRLGRARTQGMFATNNLAQAQISLGRWDEAAETLDLAFELTPNAGDHAQFMLRRYEMAIGRGQTDVIAEVQERLTALRVTGEPFVQQVLPEVRYGIEARLGEGDPAGALKLAESAIADHDLSRDVRYAWPILVAAMQACAGVGAGPEATALAGKLRAFAAEAGAFGSVMQAQKLVFAAESARFDGVLDLVRWEEIATAWERLGRPYPHAYALLRAAEALVGTGMREEAVAHLSQAVAITDRLGAAPLRAEIDQFARRHRLNVHADGAPGPAAFGLTQREREVLALVAEGRSNREIAEQLFISTKTASVHVSNILAKLGAASRGEAAATAHRLRLVEL